MSKQSYRERHTSSIYGERLIIHRRDDIDADTFFFRAKIVGRAGYVRRSSGTSNAAKAMINAEAAYEDLLIKHKGGFSLTEVTVDKFFHDWLDRKKHHFTEKRLEWKRSVYERYVSEFMGKKVLGNLTKPFCDGYWDYRLNYWKDPKRKKRIEVNEKRIGAKGTASRNIAVDPSFATLRAEASLINEFLRVATDEGYITKTIKITAQDAMPKNLRGDGYRATFTDHEWTVLTSNLYNYALGRGKWVGRLNSAHKQQRQMLRAFVLLGASTGLRVGEQKQLTWSDLRVQKNDDGNNVLVISVRSETSKVRTGRTAIAHSEHTIRVMDEFKQLSKFTEPHDLIFYSEQKDGSLRSADLSKSFKNFLERVAYEDRDRGLVLSKDGKARTLYSLRHFYAIQRLKQSVDVYQLATSMGTGVQQIRNHYGRHISGDAFIKELTKFKSKTGEKTKETAVRKLMEMVQSGTIDAEVALEQIKKVADMS